MAAATAFGLSAVAMLAEVCDAYQLDSSKSSVTTRVYRWLNLTQHDMFALGEWPELITADASFTTTGASKYNLLTLLSNNFFGKVIDRTVRFSTRNLEPRSKSFFDELDPDASDSGDPVYYCQYSKKDFRIHPKSSSGDTVKLDYVAFPAEITAATTAETMSFDYERHDLIVAGALWRAERSLFGGNAWINDRDEWRREVRRVLSLSRPMRATPKSIKPSW